MEYSDSFTNVFFIVTVCVIFAGTELRQMISNNFWFENLLQITKTKQIKWNCRYVRRLRSQFRKWLSLQQFPRPHSLPTPQCGAICFCWCLENETCTHLLFRFHFRNKYPGTKRERKWHLSYNCTSWKFKSPQEISLLVNAHWTGQSLIGSLMSPIARDQLWSLFGKELW